MGMRRLRIFLSISRTLIVPRAAGKFFMPRPAASNRIRIPEEQPVFHVISREFS